MSDVTTSLDLLRLEQNVRDAYDRLANAHIAHTRHLNKEGDGTERELSRSNAAIETAKADVRRALEKLAAAVNDLAESHHQEVDITGD